MTEPKREKTVDCLMLDLEIEYQRGKLKGYERGTILGFVIGLSVGFLASLSLTVFYVLPNLK